MCFLIKNGETKEVVTVVEQFYGPGGEGGQGNSKKNRRIFFAVAGIVIVGVGILMVLSYYFSNRCYKNFRVQNKLDRSDSHNVKYMYFNGDLLKCSRSGISIMDNTGKSLQNGGFEMNQPQVDVAGEYVVAADVTGKQFYVCNGEDEGRTIETILPVVRAKISRRGLVAVMVQDSDSNVLELYDPYNSAEKLIVEIPTNVREEGYPLDFDISPDGKSIVIAYMTVNGSAVENKVNFYNFTEVGQDKNTLVGGKTFEDSMVGQIEFVGDDEVAVFHEKGVTLFGQMKQPEVVAELTSDEAIRSAAFSEDYIAVVTGEPEAGQQTFFLYNLRGKKKLERKISYSFTDMKIYGEEIFFLSNHSCHILRTNGREKFAHEFEEGIEDLFPTENSSIYTLIRTDTIQKITLVSS